MWGVDLKHGGGEKIERGCVGRLGEDVLGEVSLDSNGSEQKLVPATREGGRARPSVACHYPGWKRGLLGCC